MREAPCGCGPCSTRREFVRDAGRFLAGGAIAGVASTVLDACSRPAERAKPHLFEASFDVGSLTTDGQSLVTPTPGLDGVPILIVRSAARRFVALSMLCTHEGCPVNPPAGGIITCPCHGSQYDLDGRVRKGPAQFPLARYDTQVDVRAKRLSVSVDE